MLCFYLVSFVPFKYTINTCFLMSNLFRSHHYKNRTLWDRFLSEGGSNNGRNSDLAAGGRRGLGFAICTHLCGQGKRSLVLGRILAAFGVSSGSELWSIIITNTMAKRKVIESTCPYTNLVTLKALTDTRYIHSI